MAFDGVPIGISDGLPEPRRFCLGRCRVSGCPSLENALGAVEKVLVTLRRRPVRPLQRYVDEFSGCHGIRTMNTLDQMAYVVARMSGRRLTYEALTS